MRAKAYKLFESYLSDRVLFVAHNGEISEHVGIKFSVPQGAIWSPLLFDLFVRYVPQPVRAALREARHFYADDLTLVKEVEREEQGGAAGTAGAGHRPPSVVPVWQGVAAGV